MGGERLSHQGRLRASAPGKGPEITSYIPATAVEIPNGTDNRASKTINFFIKNLLCTDTQMVTAQITKFINFKHGKREI